MHSRRTFLLNAAGFGAVLPFAPALAAHSRFRTRDNDFYLDGKRLQILAGEMHYPRIPRGSWRDRLRKMKSLGLNCLSAYIFWNAHEKTPGQFDFTGNLDVVAWIKMAQAEGLHVLLRPGPYVCAEWDNGGIPAWLTRDGSVGVRSREPKWLDASASWLKRLAAELAPLEIDRGGPILMTQVENEYGSFGSDHAYMRAMRDLVRAAGFKGQLYTVDGSFALNKGSLPDLVNGVNFSCEAAAEQEFKRLDDFKPVGPKICTELWDGWFDHFGEMHSSLPNEALLKNLKWMLGRKMSVSFYMAHGGTSFGFDAGANFDQKTQTYQPDITSYDYDAPMDEAGRITPKYQAIQNLLKTYLPASRFPALPVPETPITIPRFRLDQSVPLSALLSKPLRKSSPFGIEMLGQNHGMVLYRHKVEADAKGMLRCAGVRDYAIVSVDGKRIGTLDRRFHETEIAVDVKAGESLYILVDSMGHVNYGAMLGRDQKGLTGPVTLNGKTLSGWEHFSIPLDDLSGLSFRSGIENGPAFYRGHFDLTKTGYSFFDMRGWGKGYVWVNGHNLGRHWSVGPQRALFVPRDFLKTGRNEVVVMDLDPVADPALSAAPHQIWDLPGKAQENPV